MAQRVLLVSLDNLGDLVFASSLARPLRERGFEVSLFCKDYASPVAALIPGLAEVFAADPFWDKSPGRGNGGVLAFAATLARIRRAGFPSAIVASRSWRPRLCARACGISRVAFLTGAADLNRPVLEDLAPLLEPYGGATGLRCELDAVSLEKGRSRWRQGPQDRPLAALHAFAGDRRRCLPLGVLGDIAAGLRQDYRLLWIAGPSEAAALEDARGEGDLVASDLTEAAAALSTAALFIGHDSGPLHLANALGVACVGLYLPGQPRRTFPQGRGRFAMIERPGPDGVSAAQVLAAARTLLEAKQPGK